MPGRTASRSRLATSTARGGGERLSSAYRAGSRLGAGHAQKAHALGAAEMLACLPATALEDLAAHATLRRFAPGELVFSEGDPGRSLHVVTGGVLKVVRPTQDDGVMLDRLEPGQTFGELAVLNSGLRLASVVAIEESQTVEVDQADLDRVLDEHPRAVRRMLGVLARTLTLAKEQLARQNHALEQTVERRTEDLRETQLEIVRRLGQAAESRDAGTGMHITRMSRLCRRLALAAGMGAEEGDMLLHAAAMHDVGKIAIPDRILLKPGRLDAEEWQTMQGHTTLGASLLAGSRSPVVQMGEVIALTHHEKWDGSWYPRGLAGADIPLVGRIAAVCDVFDTLISERPYKQAWPVSEALAEIERTAGTHFDPDLVRLFLALPADVLASADGNAAEGPPAARNGRSHGAGAARRPSAA